MPVEETEDFIHIRVLDPARFETCRITDFNGGLPQGVRVKYCKRKNSDEWAIQAYIFTKSDGWALDKAQNWVDEHKGKRQARFAYKVKAEPLILEGGRYAKVQVIDTATSGPTDPHGVRWRVTKDALTKALKSLLQVPLLGPPELGHESKRPVGKPVQVKANDAAEAIYEITDPDAWEKIQAHEWRDVSPQVLAKAEEDNDHNVAVTDFVFEHVAFVPVGAFPQSQVEETFEGPLENFGFAYSLSAALLHGHSISDRMARDDDAMGTRLKTPIHPQVPEKQRGDRGDVMSHQKAAEFNPAAEWPDACFAYVPPSAKGEEGRKSDRGLPYRWPDGRIDADHLRNALARWNQTDFHSQEAKMDVLRELCRAAKEVDIESGLCEEELGAKKGESNMDEKEKRIAELESEVKKLQGELAASMQKQEILERKEPLKTFQAELERLKVENKELKDWRDHVIAEEQLSKASEIADLRIRAGLSDYPDRAKDIEQLKQLSASALERMCDDLLAVVTQIEAEPMGPKAKFRARKADNIVENVRAELYGFTRNEKGEVT